jgi:TRAP-type C4-dicarboxylate transport system substrate-binding protein
MKYQDQNPGVLATFMFILLVLIGTDVQAEIRIGLSSTADSENSGIYVWARAFADELEQAGMPATIYPSSTLGNEIVRTEQILLGLLEVNVTGTQEVEIYSEMIAALDLPFLFATNEESDALFHHTGYLEEINSKTRPAGMRIIDLGSLGGMSGLFTARAPIRTVADVKKFRMRAMTTEQLDWVEAWGGAGTQVAWEEVPQALQTGIADGYLNPPIVAVLFGHGGQLDYFTDLRLSPSIRVVVFSESWYQGLTEEQRAAVDRAAIVARDANRKWMVHAIAHEFQLLSDVGIEVIHLDSQQRDAFRQRVLPTYDDMVNAETLKKIMHYLESARAYLEQQDREFAE